MSRFDVAAAFANRLAGLHGHRQRSEFGSANKDMFQHAKLARIFCDRVIPRRRDAHE